MCYESIIEKNSLILENIDQEYIKYKQYIM